MATLLGLSADMYALSELLDECGEEISPEADAALTQWFAEISQDRERKLDSYAALIRSKALMIAAQTEEIERLQKRREREQRDAQWLKDRLAEHMRASCVKTIETTRYRITLAQNGGKQPVDHPKPEMLPAEFRRVRVEADVDKLRDALLAGRQVEGAALLPRGQHIRIS